MEAQQVLERLSKKDASTGRYLIKDYFKKTSLFFDDVYRYLNK